MFLTLMIWKGKNKMVTIMIDDEQTDSFLLYAYE